MIAPFPPNEAERLANLRLYDILDSEREQEFDDLTFLASRICGVPISLITLVDEDRQWYKAATGADLALTEIPRTDAFCNHTVMDPTVTLVVPDLRADPRFAQNTFVAGEPGVAFYAGAPLVSREGYALGSICVLDLQPRTLTEDQINALTRLSGQVVKLLELRRALAATDKKHAALLTAHENLRNFSHTIAHDLKAPLRNIRQYTEVINEDFGPSLPEEGVGLITTVGRMAGEAEGMINGVMRYSEAVNRVGEERESILLPEMVEAVGIRIGVPEDCRLTFRGPVETVYSSRIALDQILQNLIVNAVKFRDKPETTIDVACRSVEGGVLLSVTDNGRGIPPSSLRSLTDLFYTTGAKDGTNGHGVGLTIVKRLSEMLGDGIVVESREGEGSTFSFVVHA